jgi:hypothetical protein
MPQYQGALGQPQIEQQQLPPQPGAAALGQPAMPIAAQQPTAVSEIVRGGTGVMSNVKAGLEATVGQVFGTELFKPTTKNRQELHLLNKAITEASLLSDRNAVSEQELIRKNILVDPNAWFKNPEAAATQIQQTRDYMAGVVARNKEDIASKAVSADEERKLTNQNARFERLIRKLDEPARPEIGKMSLEQIQSADPKQYSLEELKLLDKRWQELNRGQ